MKSEITVRVHCGWKGQKSLLRQTPAQSGVWENCRFFVDDESSGDAPQSCDYLIVYNSPLSPIKTRCPKGNLWLIAGEPPTKLHEYLTDGYYQYDRLITQHSNNFGNEQIRAHGAIPWLVERDYDQLSRLQDNRANKSNRLCSITSNLSTLPGHKLRLGMLNQFRHWGVEIDIFGRGNTALPNDNKFEALYPRKYSIAMENSRYPHYWTEKIADCFLAWTMPIYFGAPNIKEYFPKESMILVDPARPRDALETIQHAISNKAWEKNLDAIEYARNKVLNELQFFPYITKQINEHQRKTQSKKGFRRVTLYPHHSDSKMFRVRVLADSLIRSVRQQSDVVGRVGQ